MSSAAARELPRSAAPRYTMPPRPTASLRIENFRPTERMNRPVPFSSTSSVVAVGKTTGVAVVDSRSVGSSSFSFITTGACSAVCPPLIGRLNWTEPLSRASDTARPPAV